MTVTASPEPQLTVVGVPVVSWLTFVAALIAAAVAGLGVRFQRKSGRESAAAAEKSAEAATKSAAAAQVSAASSERSSKAAEEAVGVNRETATGVAQRAEADALAKRYQDAATQLGHEKAPVRLAGVYAMARLADDWPEQRRTCVDVLVALLRLPWVREEVDSGGEESNESRINRRGDVEVRRTVLRLFGDHLVDSHPTSWSDIQLDLRQCELPGFRWHDPIFRAPLLLSQAILTESTTIARPTFLSDSHFEQIVLEDNLRIENARSEGNLSFAQCQVDAGLIVGLDFMAAGTTVTLEEMVVNGAFQLRLKSSKSPQGSLRFDYVNVKGMCDVATLGWQEADPSQQASGKVIYFPDVHFGHYVGPPFEIRHVTDEADFDAWPGYEKLRERPW